jgi:hypothetical protein
MGWGVKTSVLIAFFLIIVLISGLELIVRKQIFDSPEKQKCELFLLGSDSAKIRFGSIKSVKFSRKFSRLENNNGEISGRHCFLIDGSNEKDAACVEWKLIDLKFSPQRILIVHSESTMDTVWVEGGLFENRNSK